LEDALGGDNADFFGFYDNDEYLYFAQSILDIFEEKYLDIGEFSKDDLLKIKAVDCFLNNKGNGSLPNYKSVDDWYSQLKIKAEKNAGRQFFNFDESTLRLFSNILRET
jgi:hypothetical protein